MPSRRGMLTSSNSRSGLSRRTLSRPSMPSRATATENPLETSSGSRIPTACGSSSIRRILEPASAEPVSMAHTLTRRAAIRQRSKKAHGPYSPHKIESPGIGVA